VELIDSADKRLDLQYYIFRSDDSGRLIQSALLRAADRGVQIRIITDDGETVPGDEKLLLLAAHPNIAIKVFNAFAYRGHNGLLRAADFALHKSHLDYRMHNKLMIADQAVALTGGRNIGDQYFQVDPGSQFGDDDLITVGPIVHSLMEEFETYWNSPEVTSAERLVIGGATEERLAKYRAELAARRPGNNVYQADFARRIVSSEPLGSILTGATELTWAKATLVYDSPNKREVKQGNGFGRLMYGPVADRIRATREELLMITPYFVPVSGEVRLLAEANQRHVRTRILTNSLMAAPDLVAHAGYMHYRPTLLANGVQLYEIRSDLGNPRGSGESRRMTRYGNYALHAKIFVFDRQSAYVGSMNLDQRSVHLNTEMGLIIESEALAAELAARFTRLTSSENAYEVRLDRDEHGRTELCWITRENGKDIEYSTEPAPGPMRRIEVRLLSLLPIDREL
jgi:putative cardiolipin synthase